MTKMRRRRPVWPDHAEHDQTQHHRPPGGATELSPSTPGRYHRNDTRASTGQLPQKGTDHQR